MKHKGFKLLRNLTVWAAVLVQIHLFFVGELHRHLAAEPLPGIQGTAYEVIGQAQAAPENSPLCAACQISRQGSVQPTPQSLGIQHLFKERSRTTTLAFYFPSTIKVPASGRDPPRS